MTHVALVLSGGGARAAYQVGALQAIARVLGAKASPFSILTGVSAGAINTAAVASGADNFARAVDELAETWIALRPESVYRTDTPKLTALGMRWLKDLAAGGLLGKSRSNHLLDTRPLRELLHHTIDLSRVTEHFDTGILRGVAFSATNYLTGDTVTFYDGVAGLKPWARYDRIAWRGLLDVDHVMAAAAIPLFFPPMIIDGKPFGDGGIRLKSPISPAIQLGADKILAIGIRHARNQEQTLELNRTLRNDHVSAAEIGGVMLNALFLDALDNDLERLQRVNRTLGLVSEAQRSNAPDVLRSIPALLLRPSQDLGRLAADEYVRFPAVLRHLLGGLGATSQSGWDLFSYLAFQPSYVEALVELGRSDTLARRAEIEAFFSD